MSWLDPAADITRRAWIPCPTQDHAGDCKECWRGRNCERHWVYLLESHGRDLFLQCPTCLHRWWHAT